MTNWVFKGLRTGIKTRRPSAETTPGLSPGRPQATQLPAEDAVALTRRCPTGAILATGGEISVEQRRCVHCFRCLPESDKRGLPWADGFEWAGYDADAQRQRLNAVFGRSLHIRFVDAGACGACMSEARQLNNPYYNMHALGFFMTPTPRNADVLMVAGPVSDAMRLALRKTYDAIPTPKRVIAIGACAASGGVFGPSFASGGGVAEMIPVDVVVPGCPPPPLAILHALLVVVERKPPSELVSRATHLGAGTP